MNQKQPEGASDPLFESAKAHVIEEQRASFGMVQRKFKIGYMRAGNLIDALEAAGVLSSPTHKGHRTVLVAREA
jgi:S-DNA-T family DNA segregation ATPase FtsK/SpoIIIE